MTFFVVLSFQFSIDHIQLETEGRDEAAAVMNSVIKRCVQSCWISGVWRHHSLLFTDPAGQQRLVQSHLWQIYVF